MTTRSIVQHVSVLIVALIWPTILRAQVAVDGGAGVVVVRAPTLDEAPGPSLPSSGIGGTTIGGIAGASVRVAPRISIGGEITIEKTFNFSERALIGATIRGSFSEVIIAGVLRYDILSTLQFVGGVSLVAPNLIGVGASPGTTFGGVIGVDAPVPVAPHFAFVPAFRLHMIRRTDPDQPADIVKQIGSLVFAPAALLRVTF